MNKLMNGDVLVAECANPIVWNDSQQGYVVDNCIYVGSHFTVVSTPEVVTPRQFKLALLAQGLLDDVELMIASSGDRALAITYEQALEFKRDDPMVIAMGAALGKTDAEIDALFVLAATL